MSLIEEDKALGTAYSNAFLTKVSAESSMLKKEGILMAPKAKKIPKHQSENDSSTIKKIGIKSFSM